MERVRMAIAVATRYARGRTTTSWADVLVKKVHANLPKQWKAEIIFYEDGDDDDDDDDDDDKKEEDGDEDDNGKRKREGKRKQTKRAATTMTRTREFVKKAATDEKMVKEWYATSRDTDARVVSRLLRLTSADTLLLMYPSSPSSSSFSSSSGSSRESEIYVSVGWIRSAGSDVSERCEISCNICC